MKLYKFRSFDRFDYISDILLNGRLHCAKYRNLNDPFEGLYVQTVYPRMGFFNRRLGAPQRTEKISVRRDLPAVYAEKRVCALSDERAVEDTRMWAHYAGGHGGVAIEFDFPDPKSHGIHQVDYKPRIPEILVAGPPMEELDESPTPEFVLTKKTMPWQYEREWRIIQDKTYFELPDSPTAVLVGIKISEANNKLIERITSFVDVELVFTDIDDSGKIRDPRRS